MLVVGLDDQGTLDRMFALRELRPGDANLKHAWAERSLASAAQLGQYGVHFVPSPPDVALLKARAGDPRTLRAHPRADRLAGARDPRHEERSRGAHPERLPRGRPHPRAGRGLVVARGGREDLRAARALGARRGARADRVHARRPPQPRSAAARGRRCSRGCATRCAGAAGPTTRRRSRAARASRRSTRAAAAPRSILHHAKGTEVHAQFRELTLEVLGDLGISDRLDLRAARAAGRGRRRALGRAPRAGARALRRAGAGGAGRTLSRRSRSARRSTSVIRRRSMSTFGICSRRRPGARDQRRDRRRGHARACGAATA